MTEQSTNEGQQESILEPVLSGQEGNKTPGNLAPRPLGVPGRRKSVRVSEFVALHPPSQNVPLSTKLVAWPLTPKPLPR